MSAKRGKRKRRDELARRPRHNYLDGVSLVLKAADQFRRFVRGGNSARDPEGDAHVGLAGALLAPLGFLFLFRRRHLGKVVFNEPVGNLFARDPSSFLGARVVYHRGAPAMI